MSGTNIGSLNRRLTSTVLDNDFKLSKISNFKLSVVVDVILDDKHPYFGTNTQTNYKNVDPPKIGTKRETIPANYKKEIPNSDNLDYSYIGRVKFRILGEEIKTAIDKLPWAIPLDNTITQIPLINEQIMVIKMGENYFYTKNFNKFNFVGTNADFSTESSNGKTTQSAVPYEEPVKKLSYTSHPSFYKTYKPGYLGNYFILNPNIRSIRKYEGDTVIESRFGQSIRMGAYDDNRSIDNDNSKNKKQTSSYLLDGNIFEESKEGGYGNPRLTIRNRQRNLAKDTISPGSHPLLPKIPAITEREKNYGGQIDADVNNDGSTIDMTSGLTISSWKSSVYKSVFSIQRLESDVNNLVGGEEQKNFCPNGSTLFVLPELSGDQIVINSDRLVLSSRLAESMHFSKKRYSITTDSEFTVDSNDQIVLTTNNLTCLNSPQIFLGQYGETNEPALLGQTTVDWLYDLCNWLLDHVHWYHHVHPHPHGHVDAGAIDILNTLDSQPDQTQIPVQQMTLKLLRDNLHRTLSRRVFVTGGGYAPGSNGVKPIGSGGDCRNPLIINTVNGLGVVGDFKGRNRREGPTQIQIQKK